MTLIEQIANRSNSQRVKTHILCVCAGGNTRSVTLATLLKFHYGGYDALACSLEKNSRDTLHMLFDWSDLILVADQHLYKELMEDHDYELKHPGEWALEPKMVLIDIGQDKWGMSMHPELTPVACKLLEEAGFRRGGKTPDDIVARLVKYEDRRKESDGPTIYLPS